MSLRVYELWSDSLQKLYPQDGDLRLWAEARQLNSNDTQSLGWQALQRGGPGAEFLPALRLGLQGRGAGGRPRRPRRRGASELV